MWGILNILLSKRNWMKAYVSVEEFGELLTCTLQKQFLKTVLFNEDELEESPYWSWIRFSEISWTTFNFFTPKIIWMEDSS